LVPFGANGGEGLGQVGRARLAALTTAVAVVVVLPSSALAVDVVGSEAVVDQAAEDGSASDPAVDAEGLDGAEGDLDEVEDELSKAARTYEDIVAILERAERELEQADERMHAASAQLARVERELAAAEQARAEAETAKEQAAEQFAASEAQLAAAVEAEAAAVELLELRTIEVYKYGVGLPQKAMVQSLVSASDWHEVAVVATTVGRVVASDREIVRGAEDRRTDADTAREEADRSRQEAAAAEARAIAEHEDVETLLASQRSAVAQIRVQQQRRTAILAELEADAEVSALLLSKLEEQVAGLRSLPDPRLVAAPAPAADPPAAAPAPTPPASPEPEPAPTPPSPAPTTPAPSPSPAPPPTASPPPTPTPSPTPSPSPSPTPTPTPTADPTPPPGTAPAWASRLPTAGRPWAASIDTAARANGLDGRLLAALVWTESTFRPDVVSSAGAIGLTQLMPGTAASLGVDPWVPTQNLDGGARYLMMQLNRFGSVELALAAYNAGPTRVANAGPGIPDITETQLYVIKVLERYALLVG
jgi:hypothetical protein